VYLTGCGNFYTEKQKQSALTTKNFTDPAREESTFLIHFTKEAKDKNDITTVPQNLKELLQMFHNTRAQEQERFDLDLHPENSLITKKPSTSVNTIQAQLETLQKAEAVAKAEWEEFDEKTDEDTKLELEIKYNEAVKATAKFKKDNKIQ
jgi:hypothetical protein